MTDVTASVIIPHYNDPERLERCLNSLKQNNLEGVEVIVVDNNSPKPLDSVKAAFPEFEFLVESKKGAAEARNTGIRHAKSDLFLFIDADCVADENWVARAKEVAGNADLIGGRVDVFDETPPPKSGAEAFEAVFAFDFKNYIEVQRFTGAGNLVTSRRIFESIGYFENGVSEDRDWSMRAVRAGHSLIYDDQLVVAHPSRSDWTALREKWHRLTQELFASHMKDDGRRWKWAIRALAMPASAALHSLKVIKSPNLGSVGDRIKGLFTLFRLRGLRMVWMLMQSLGRGI